MLTSLCFCQFLTVPCRVRTQDCLGHSGTGFAAQSVTVQSKSTDKAPLLTIPFLEVSPPRNDAFLANRKLLHRKREADGLDVFAEDKGFCQLKYSHVEVQKDRVEERMLDDPCYVDSHCVIICSI